MVLGQKTTRRALDEDLEDESEGRGSFTPDFKSKAPEPADFNAPDITPKSNDSDEDDALSYFNDSLKTDETTTLEDYEKAGESF